MGESGFNAKSFWRNLFSEIPRQIGELIVDYFSISRRTQAMPFRALWILTTGISLLTSKKLSRRKVTHQVFQRRVFGTTKLVETTV